MTEREPGGSFNLKRSISRRDLLKAGGALLISGVGISLLGCGEERGTIEVRALHPESTLVLVERDDNLWYSDNVIGGRNGNLFITHMSI